MAIIVSAPTSAIKKSTPKSAGVFRLLTGHHSREENGVRVQYAPGDILELNTIELATHRYRVEPAPGQKATVPIMRTEEGVAAASSIPPPTTPANTAVNTDTDTETDTETNIDTNPIADADTDTDIDWSFLSTVSETDAVQTVSELETVLELSSARVAESSGLNRPAVLAAINARTISIKK